MTLEELLKCVNFDPSPEDYAFSKEPELPKHQKSYVRTFTTHWLNGELDD